MCMVLQQVMAIRVKTVTPPFRKPHPVFLPHFSDSNAQEEVKGSENMILQDDPQIFAFGLGGGDPGLRCLSSVSVGGEARGT